LSGTVEGVKMTPNIFLTIPTKRLEESLTFYTTILGFTLTRRLDRPGGVVLAFLSRDEFIIEFVLNPNIPAGEVGTFAPILSFHVSNLTEILATLSEVGIQPPQPNERPGGVTILGFKDPNGVPIHFITGER
jgi:catechol 2,3-dioxygenase-like lactoylglutathione lyase family enzyme